MGLDYGQSEKEKKEFIDFYHSWGLEVSIHRYSDRLGESRYQPKKIKQPVFAKRYPCHWLFEKMIILFDGLVTTCYYDLSGQMTIGNLKDYDYSIKAIWKSEKLEKLRKKHNNLCFEGPCLNCLDWTYNHPMVKGKFGSYVTVYPIEGKSYQV